MDENAAASLALDAAQTLEGIGEDVAQIKGQNSDVLAAIESLRQTEVEGFRQLIARDAELAIAADAPEDSNWVTEVRSSVEVPPLLLRPPHGLPVYADGSFRLPIGRLPTQPGRDALARLFRQMEVVMDAFLNVLLVLSLLGVVAYAFAVYEVLKIVTAWARDRWKDDWGKRPLLLKLPPKALTAVLVLCFLAVAL